MREYRRRFALAPSRAPSRRELIEESAYAAAEADGFFAPDRTDVALAAIYYLLGALATTRGVDLAPIARNLGDWDSIRPSPEEREERDVEETLRAFAPLLKRALRAAGLTVTSKENRHD